MISKTTGKILEGRIWVDVIQSVPLVSSSQFRTVEVIFKLVWKKYSAKYSEFNEICDFINDFKRSSFDQIRFEKRRF